MNQRLPAPFIDADGHILERQSGIRKYLDPSWNDRTTSLWPGDQRWGPDMFGKLPGYPGYPKGQGPAEQGEFWLAVMDECNVEHAVLFPTGSGNISKLREKEYAVAVCRAANNHFAKGIQYALEPVRAVGVLPLKCEVAGGGLWEHKDLSREANEKILYQNARTCFPLAERVPA
ncbi:MAG TPA: hypothetical protein VFC51_15310 [Chloroflexota bacterium]|nr:hypothetical protein [Chloroflexota bacterium]